MLKFRSDSYEPSHHLSADDVLDRKDCPCPIQICCAISLRGIANLETGKYIAISVYRQSLKLCINLTYVMELMHS